MSSKPLISIVDDDKITLEILTAELQSREREIRSYLTAASFRQGLQAAEPSLLLLDALLPDANGFDLLRALKVDPLFKKIPVLMMSSEMRSSSDIVEGIEAGAEDYLAKPFAPEVV